jgi:hypothetical protein
MRHSNVDNILLTEAVRLEKRDANGVLVETLFFATGDSEITREWPDGRREKIALAEEGGEATDAAD